MQTATGCPSASVIALNAEATAIRTRTFCGSHARSKLVLSALDRMLNFVDAAFQFHKLLELIRSAIVCEAELDAQVIAFVAKSLEFAVVRYLEHFRSPPRSVDVLFAAQS